MAELKKLLDPGSTVREGELGWSPKSKRGFSAQSLRAGQKKLLDPGSTVREGELKLDPVSVVRETEKKLTELKKRLSVEPGFREGEPGHLGRPELGALGEKIVGYLPNGRPIISNPDGSLSTERTTTVQLPNGKWINIPTMFDGKEVSVNQAFDIMEQNEFTDPETGAKAKEFKSMREAEKSAALGSKGKDQLLEKAIEQYSIERRLFPTMFDESGKRIK